MHTCMTYELWKPHQGVMCKMTSQPWTYLFFSHIHSSHMTIFTNKFTKNKTVLSWSTAKVQDVHTLKGFWDC